MCSAGRKALHHRVTSLSDGLRKPPILWSWQNTRRDSNCPPFSSAFPQREPGQWKSSGWFPHTSLAPVPILHICPTPWGNTTRLGIAKTKAPAQGPSPHEGYAVDQVFFSLCHFPTFPCLRKCSTYNLETFCQTISILAVFQFKNLSLSSPLPHLIPAPMSSLLFSCKYNAAASSQTKISSVSSNWLEDNLEHNF